MKGTRLLGFAQKAGKVVTGYFACEQALQRKRARLVLLATDAAPNTREYFIGLCNRQGIPYRVWNTKAELGAILGKSPRAVVAILDCHFAETLAKQIG